MNALRFLTPFFLNHAVHSSISTLSLHDALPISGPRAARRLIAVDERSDARELGLEPRTPARSPAGVRTAWLRRRRHQPGFCGGVLRVHQGEARRHVLGLRLRLAAALVGC